MEPVFLSTPPEQSRVRMVGWQTFYTYLSAATLCQIVNCGPLKSLSTPYEECAYRKLGFSVSVYLPPY